MINQISTKTRFGWISAFENHGKIFKIKFGLLKNQKKSKILESFRKNYLNFLTKEYQIFKLRTKWKEIKFRKNY